MINSSTFIYWRKHILKRTIVNFPMRTLNPEWGFEMKIILNAWKYSFILRSRFCRYHSIGTDFEWRHNILCNVYWEKHCLLLHQFQRGVIWIQQTSVVIHQITLCEINSIKSDNNGRYIINRFITKLIPNEPANFGNPRKLAPRNKIDSTVYLL